MKPWIRPRYYCTNISGRCHHAMADTPFSTDDFTRNAGLCQGHDGQTCGQPLKPGDPLDLRPRWIVMGMSCVLIAGAAGFGLSTMVLPPLIKHVNSAAAENKANRLVAEQSVRTASVMAKEIADSVVRQRVLDQLLAASRDKPGEFDQYRQSLAIVNGNLSRARESYMQMLRDLQALQPGIVLSAMDHVSQDLASKGFAQQGQTVSIMKRQFTELLNHRNADMDRWATELSQVVPRVNSGTRRPPST